MLGFLGQYLPNFNDGVGNLTKVQIFIERVWVGPEILYLNLFPVSAAKLLAHGAQVVGKSIGWSPKGQR